ALRDVLPVAGEIDEADGLFVEHAQEPGGAAAMLDVGLAVGVRGGEEDARLRRDEGGELGRDPGLPGAALLPGRIAAARALPGLDRLHRRREGDVAGIDRRGVHRTLR